MDHKHNGQSVEEDREQDMLPPGSKADQEEAAPNHGTRNRYFEQAKDFLSYCREEWNGLKFDGKVEAASAVVIAISTTFYVIFTLGLWNQTAALSASAHREQRAWISINRFVLDKELVYPDTSHLKTFIANTGKTPGKEVAVSSRISLIEPKDPIVEPNWDNIERLPQAVVQELPATSPISIGKYTRKEMNLLAWVRVDYRDIFGIPHWSKYCTIHTFGDPLDQFRFCPRGNDVDDNE